MGSAQSSNIQLQPAREPKALLNTGAGVIVRIPDPVNGASIYQHNHRVATAPTSIVGGDCDRQQTHVAVVRPGDRNQALKASIVYLKNTPKNFVPRAHKS